MRTAAVIARTERFIRENFVYARPDTPISPDTGLLESGIVDSMAAVELVEFLSATFGVTIEDHEITEENLGSLAAIGRWIGGRLDEAGAELVVS
jgi:acyl carrier protein